MSNKKIVVMIGLSIFLSSVFSLNSFAIESNESSSKVVCIPDEKYCGYGVKKDSCEGFDPEAKYPNEAVFGISCASLDCDTDCPVSL